MPVRSLILAAALAAAALALPPGAAAETAAETVPETAPETAPGAADAAGRLAEFIRVMQVPAMMEVLRDEAIDYALTLDADLFGGSGGAAWRQQMEALHDLPAMRARFETALAAALADDAETIAAALVFFGTDRGQRILTLEIEARRALLDEAVEDAARARFGQMAADRDPRLELLRAFSEANDLVEMNVQGALNANLAFYRGLVAAGGPGTEDMTEDQILADVWSQEADVRAETEAWLFPFLALAYSGLPDEDLRAYIDYSAGPAGRRMNAALFAAFDSLFNAQAFALGRATGQQLAGQDL